MGVCHDKNLWKWSPLWENLWSNRERLLLEQNSSTLITFVTLDFFSLQWPHSSHWDKTQFLSINWIWIKIWILAIFKLFLKSKSRFCARKFKLSFGNFSSKLIFGQKLNICSRVCSFQKPKKWDFWNFFTQHWIV